jgi:hypothetical protein
MSLCVNALSVMRCDNLHALEIFSFQGLLQIISIVMIRTCMYVHALGSLSVPRERAASKVKMVHVLLLL